MGHDFAEDRAQCARAKRIVIGDGQMMFAAGLGGKAAVRAELPDKLVPKSATKGLFQFGG